MDPNATLKTLLFAIIGGDVEDARQDAEELVRWLRKGGFPPNWMLVIERFIREEMED